MRKGSSLSSLWGSIELAQFDKEALNRFDLTMAGFWRSFTVVLVLVPLFLLVMYLQNTYIMRLELKPNPYSLTLLAFLVEWVIFVGLLAIITSFLNVFDKFPGAMAVYNWCRPVAFSFLLPVFAAGASGLANTDVMFLLYYIALTLRSIYLGYILHLTLKVGFGAILAIILLDFVLGQVVFTALKGLL